MDNVTKIGSGGRLYKDSRDKESQEHAKAESERERRAEEARLKESRAKEAELFGRIFHARQKEPQQNEKPEQQVAPPPPPPAKAKKERDVDWREVRSSVFELAGVVALTAGGWMLRPWLGLIVLGVCLLLIGIAIGVPTEKNRR